MGGGEFSTAEIQIRRAVSTDLETVSVNLREVADWLDSRGMGLWRLDELMPTTILQDVSDGLFFLAEHPAQPVGTLKFQLSDELFWPDVSQDDAAYIHRVAVRRKFAGGKVSFALMLWAVQHTHS